MISILDTSVLQPAIVSMETRTLVLLTSTKHSRSCTGSAVKRFGKLHVDKTSEFRTFV
jgi:hypothetical protein